MYTDWFKLKKLPFRLRPDPEFLYLTDAIGLVYGTLRAAVSGGQKLMCLLGGPGAGKTTLLHALARDCQGAATVARIHQPSLTAEELESALAEQFGLSPPESEAREPWAQLKRYLAQQAAQGRAVAILVDEAHQCTLPMLTELLKMTPGAKGPLIVLAGEPELADSLATLKLSHPALPVPETLRLAPLTQAQIAGYIAFRLRVAGYEGRELFEHDTIVEIFRYTGGTPQLINTLCDSALLFAEARSTARVGVIEVREAARDLKWIEFSARGTPTGTLSDTANPGQLEPWASATGLSLEVRRNGEFVSQVALVPGRLVVGRGTDAGLRLESRFISRRHCQFITTAEQTLIEDLGSANGIHVNGQRYHVYRLTVGDQVALSDYTLDCISTVAMPAAT
jgi:general secretion pathway protein A